jgi:hypothetical protein
MRALVRIVIVSLAVLMVAPTLHTAVARAETKKKAKAPPKTAKPSKKAKPGKKKPPPKKGTTPVYWRTKKGKSGKKK